VISRFVMVDDGNIWVLRQNVGRRGASVENYISCKAEDNYIRNSTNERRTVLFNQRSLIAEDY
jgi:hypothetical protein